MSNDKNRNKRRVIQYRRKYPGMRASEIAKKVGISRERVRQILKAEGLPTTIENLPVNVCSVCAAKMVSRKTTTCRDCIIKNAWVEVHCETCDTLKKVRKSTYKYRAKQDNHRYNNKYYCGRECFYKRPDPFKKG